jgi:hypothetical protein
MHVIASMQATMAYLMERVSILETRLLQQQDMMTQFKTEHAPLTTIINPNVPTVEDQSVHVIINEDVDVCDADMKKRFKLVF